MSLPDPEVVKMNIASSITVTAISSNDNCIMSPISLDHLFPHSDKNISIPRPLLKFFSSFFSALSLYPPSLFQLSEPGISFWLNDFFLRCGNVAMETALPRPPPLSARAERVVVNWRVFTSAARFSLVPLGRCVAGAYRIGPPLPLVFFRSYILLTRPAWNPWKKCPGFSAGFVA